MTALSEYARLEGTGLWRPDPGGQRREVGVSFGEATLVITDNAGRPLTHWSLAAVQRQNPGARPAIFAPDGEVSETLELDDPDMIDAIEKVRRTLIRRKASPGRLRRLGGLAVLAALVLLAVLWLPEALLRQALSSVPVSKRSEVGATLLGHIQRATGPACRDPRGVQAMARLKARVLGPGAPGQIVVLPGELDAPLYLPGGLILLGRAMAEQAGSAEVVAGHVLSAAVSREEVDPLAPLLRRAGPGATVTLFTTGDIPPEAVADHAQYLLTNPAPMAEDETLIATFAHYNVPLAPWARTQERLALAGADTLAGRDVPEILSDGDWLALRGICRG